MALRLSTLLLTGALAFAPSTPLTAAPAISLDRTANKTLIGTRTAPSPQCRGGTCSSQISQLNLSAKGLTVRLSGSLEGLTCTPLSRTFFELPAASPLFGDMHAMLLAAYLAGETVTLSGPSKGRCQISNIALAR